MKPNRKAKAVRRPARRATPALSISARVERLEKELLFKTPATAVHKAVEGARFTNLDTNGRPTTGEHVTVRDNRTGLEWTAAPIEGGKGYEHAAAMKACATLTLGGHKDWRAPTIQELLSIIDYGRKDPAVDPEHFKGPYGWTWTSTPYAGNPSGAAWLVYLLDGYSLWFLHGLDFHARAVRAGQQLGLTE
jgi:hypothetical protein